MRAGSVKQIGSQAANAAADRLDGALTVADEYMDRYLPGDPADKDPVDKDSAGKHQADKDGKYDNRIRYCEHFKKTF